MSGYHKKVGKDKYFFWKVVLTITPKMLGVVKKTFHYYDFQGNKLFGAQRKSIMSEDKA